MSLEEGMKFQTIAEEQIALEHLYKDSVLWIPIQLIADFELQNCNF
jgi:hypothetical protein